MISFRPYLNPELDIINSIYRWEYWDLERLCDLLQVTALIRGKTSIQTSVCLISKLYWFREGFSKTLYALYSERQTIKRKDDFKIKEEINFEIFWLGKSNDLSPN